MDHGVHREVPLRTMRRVIVGIANGELGWTREPGQIYVVRLGRPWFGQNWGKVKAKNLKTETVAVGRFVHIQD